MAEPAQVSLGEYTELRFVIVAERRYVVPVNGMGFWGPELELDNVKADD